MFVEIEVQTSQILWVLLALASLTTTSGQLHYLVHGTVAVLMRIKGRLRKEVRVREAGQAGEEWREAGGAGQRKQD